jgi:hypothetical protein
MAGKRGKRGKDAQIELNLVPIMALLCVLIPVLLAAFNFFEITVQAMSVPRMATGKPKAKKTKKTKPLNLTLYIDERSISVTMQKEHIGTIPGFPPGKLVIPKREFDVGGDSASYYGNEKREEIEYDYPALHSWLVKIKKAVWDTKKVFKKEPRTINVSAKFDIPWRIIARTIDAARVRLDADDYGTERDSMEKYSQAKPKKQDRKDEAGNVMENEAGEAIQEDKPLFDAVVFTVPK